VGTAAAVWAAANTPGGTPRGFSIKKILVGVIGTPVGTVSADLFRLIQSRARLKSFSLCERRFENAGRRRRASSDPASQQTKAAHLRRLIARCSPGKKTSTSCLIGTPRSLAPIDGDRGDGSGRPTLYCQKTDFGRCRGKAPRCWRRPRQGSTAWFRSATQTALDAPPSSKRRKSTVDKLGTIGMVEISVAILPTCEPGDTTAPDVARTREFGLGNVSRPRFRARPFNPHRAIRAGWRAFTEYGNGNRRRHVHPHGSTMVRWVLDLGWPKADFFFDRAGHSRR